MPKQYDEIINFKIENLNFKNPQYIAKKKTINAFEYWNHFWEIFETNFIKNFIFQKPDKNDFNHRVIYLETLNKNYSCKTLFVLSLPEGHMLKTAGKVLSRLEFRNPILKKYIRNKDSIFFVTFYAPLKNTIIDKKDELKNLNKALNSTDFNNTMLIISGLKEIWNSSREYGKRYLTILNNEKDTTKGFISIEIKFEDIIKLYLQKNGIDLRNEIIYERGDKFVNINNPFSEKEKKENQSYNLVTGKEFITHMNFFIESNEKFKKWIQEYLIETNTISEIKKIEKNKTLKKYEKAILEKARIGQGEFRNKLIEIYQKCPITHISETELLVASHIKPWADSEDYEKIDPNNGILFSALYDKLFDKGLITFDDDSRIRFSDKLSDHTRQQLIIKEYEKANLRINEERKKYLKYHRENIFLKNDKE